MLDQNVIRALGPQDYDALWDLFLIVFPVKYKNEFLDAWLARNPSLSLGAFGADGTLQGFVITTQKGGDGTSGHEAFHHIEFLGVRPTCQKGGFGTVLLGKVLDYCRKTSSRATLIPVNDHRIISWYKKHGFEFFGSPKISPYTGDLEQTMLFS